MIYTSIALGKTEEKNYNLYVTAHITGNSDKEKKLSKIFFSFFDRPNDESAEKFATQTHSDTDTRVCSYKCSKSDIRYTYVPGIAEYMSRNIAVTCAGNVYNGKVRMRRDLSPYAGYTEITHAVNADTEEYIHRYAVRFIGLCYMYNTCEDIDSVILSDDRINSYCSPFIRKQHDDRYITLDIPGVHGSSAEDEVSHCFLWSSRFCVNKFYYIPKEVISFRPWDMDNAISIREKLSINLVRERLGYEREQFLRILRLDHYGSNAFLPDQYPIWAVVFDEGRYNIIALNSNRGLDTPEFLQAIIRLHIPKNIRIFKNIEGIRYLVNTDRLVFVNENSMFRAHDENFYGQICQQ